MPEEQKAISVSKKQKASALRARIEKSILDSLRLPPDLSMTLAMYRPFLTERIDTDKALTSNDVSVVFRTPTKRFGVVIAEEVLAITPLETWKVVQRSVKQACGDWPLHCEVLDFRHAAARWFARA